MKNAILLSISTLGIAAFSLTALALQPDDVEGLKNDQMIQFEHDIPFGNNESTEPATLVSYLEKRLPDGRLLTCKFFADVPGRTGPVRIPAGKRYGVAYINRNTRPEALLSFDVPNIALKDEEGEIVAKAVCVRGSDFFERRNRKSNDPAKRDYTYRLWSASPFTAKSDKRLFLRALGATEVDIRAPYLPDVTPLTPLDIKYEEDAPEENSNDTAV